MVSIETKIFIHPPPGVVNPGEANFKARSITNCERLNKLEPIRN